MLRLFIFLWWNVYEGTELNCLAEEQEHVPQTQNPHGTQTQPFWNPDRTFFGTVTRNSRTETAETQKSLSVKCVFFPK